MYYYRYYPGWFSFKNKRKRNVVNLQCVNMCGGATIPNHKNRNIIMFTNARDERHIKEWAAHHLNLGADRLVIFDHKSTLPIASVLKGSDERIDVCSYTGNKMNGLKTMFIEQAIKMALRDKYTWMLYLDADEFVILNQFANFSSFLDTWKEADVIVLNWLFFGSNHLLTSSGTILASYNRSHSRLNEHVKSLVRPDKLTKHIPSAHTYNLIEGSVLKGVDNVTMGKNDIFHPIHMNFSDVPGYVAHYYIQSREDFLWRKMNRSRDDTGGKWPFTLAALNDNNDVLNMLPTLRYDTANKKMMEAMESNRLCHKENLRRRIS